MRIVSAKAIPGAPTSAGNIQLGRDVAIKKDGKATISALPKTKGSAAKCERVKLTRAVQSVAALLKVDFAKTTVLVWYENLRLATDETFFPATKKKARGRRQKPQARGPRRPRSERCGAFELAATILI